jgi:hypothetical protein
MSISTQTGNEPAAVPSGNARYHIMLDVGF